MSVVTDTAARVREMVQSGGGVTAAQVADALGVSRPTAYKYVKALRKEFGKAIVARRERISARGPKSRVYYPEAGRRSR